MSTPVSQDGLGQVDRAIRHRAIVDSIQSSASRVLTILMWSLLAGLVLWIAIHERSFQWDFRVFYEAPHALQSGANPYYTGEPGASRFSYLYPPLVLYIFRPLSELPFGAAYLIWLCAKLLAIGILLRLWHRHFEQLSFAWPSVLFVVLAFNTALLSDLVAGNIATFELLGIWTAFYLLLKERPYAAGAVFAVIAQFKLVPIVFVLLLLFVGPRRGWRPLLVSLAIFATLLLLNYVFMPEMTLQYLQSFAADNPNLDERGTSNPSALALIRDVAGGASAAGINLPQYMPTLVFLLYVAALALAMLWVVRTQVMRWTTQNPRWWFYLACVLYALAMPRVKGYSLSILLIPALFVIRRFGVTMLVPLLGVLVLLPSRSTPVPGLGAITSFIQAYLPWFTAWVLLYFLLSHMLEAVGTQSEQGREGAR